MFICLISGAHADARNRGDGQLFSVLAVQIETGADLSMYWTHCEDDAGGADPALHLVLVSGGLARESQTISPFTHPVSMHCGWFF